jgi:exodeoxyribonuclease III
VRLYSWNVSGLRAAVKKGFFEWLEATRPDVACIQETKVDPAILPDDIARPLGYHGYWAVPLRKGYSGVATFTRQPVAAWQAGFGLERFDLEGRVIATDLGDFDLYNVYFPNGGMGPERLAYKLDFYDAFLEHVEARRAAGREVVFCGDVNTAHRELDLARPKENRKVSGFLPVECAHLDRWLERGWVDTFRHLHPEARAVYSYWDQRFRARDRNVGWRIDYFYVHRDFLPRVLAAGIDMQVPGSDHCPVWLELAD